MSDFKAKKEVAVEILSQFVCSLCQDVPGPIGVRKNRYACQNGHLVCENCKFGECSCKSKIFIGPMQHVEKILETLQWHNCHNFKFGCRDVIETKLLDEHQKFCIYRQIFCPELSCETKILFKDIIDHTGTDHKNWKTVATKEDEKTFLVSYDKEMNFIKRYVAKWYPELRIFILLTYFTCMYLFKIIEFLVRQRMVR